MANSIKYTWNVFCVTEGAYIPTVQKPKPSVCPNNAGHTIDLDQTRYIATLAESTILDNPNSVGYYLAQGINFTAGANTATTYDYSFPFDVNVLHARLFCEDENKGDTLNILLAPNLGIGMLTQDAKTGDTDINVDSTVMDFAVKGTRLTFNADTTAYYAKSVDLDNSTITLTTPLSMDFSTGTVVIRSVHLIKDFLLPTKATVYIAQNNLKNPVIPAGYVFRFIYNNISLVSKTVNLILDCY